MRRFSSATQEEMGSFTATSRNVFRALLIQASAAENMSARIAGSSNGFPADLSGRPGSRFGPAVDRYDGRFGVAAVIVYGGHRVIDGATTPGAFFSFITAA